MWAVLICITPDNWCAVCYTVLSLHATRAAAVRGSSYLKFWTLTIQKYLTPWSWALLQELPVVQLLKNFLKFYENRRLITVFTRALHWSISWARSIQHVPAHSISVESILILFFHLRLNLDSGMFSSDFRTKCVYMYSSSPPFVLRAPLIVSSLTWSF
jgi:hypothetical protein